ncbi:MAG TPA: ATP-binding protein [Bryobacteraceae bacterium]|nr:ATP-binding protein [Bryobacteraceae bacterium]
MIPAPGKTKRYSFPIRIPQGITARISGLSWTITLSTLLVFVAASIPEQKRDLFDGLQSKALSISSSLHEVASSSAVTADYSSLVEHCVQVLAADKAIEYLVATKADGFSIVISRDGWRTEQLGSYWRPAERSPHSAITRVPLFNKRVFHFAVPLDYSSIQWGWINVGLALDAYDQSVGRIYTRTAILAILCVTVSLIASVIYARQLVRPILGLQTVVGKLAEGDLSARASIHTRDEIESLAQSFNSMAESLAQRDRILESVRFAAQQFLSAAGWQTVIQDVLAKLGQSAQASRAFVFENHPGEEQGLVGTVRYQWTAPGLKEGLAAYPAYSRSSNSRWEPAAASLRRGEVVSTQAPDGGEAGPCSSILIPLEVAGEWFGFLGVEDWTRQRQWNHAESDSFRAASGILGASITRQQAQEYVDNILRSMDESLIVTDPDLRIRRVNPRTLDLLDYREEDLIGQHAGQVMRESEGQGQTTGVERIFRTRSGKNIPVLFSSAELRNGLGLLEGYVWLGQDVTELKRAQEELVRARDEAEQANRSKSTFLANMSHELRTPLNAIIGYSQMLQEDCGLAPSAQFRPDLEKIERSGHMLLGIINDILDLSKIEAGRMELRLETFSVADVLRDVHGAVQPLAAQRGNLLEVVCPDAACEGYGDVAKFRQSLLNLVNNACKFTENGKVSIAVRKVRGPQRTELEVRVSDTGIGIDPNHLGKLFQPFSQVDGSATRKYGGTGLGLAISRKFCQMMGGDITVKSELGRGSEFSLRIPVTFGEMNAVDTPTTTTQRTQIVEMTPGEKETVQHASDLVGRR